MRCAVPSSKVGSLDSASAAAERESGVEGTGFASDFASDFTSDLACGFTWRVTWGGLGTATAAPIRAATAGLAGGATTEFWQTASVANKLAIATMVIFRIFLPGILRRTATACVELCAFNGPIRNPVPVNVKPTVTNKH